MSITTVNPEKAPVRVFARADQASRFVAGEIAKLIRDRDKANRPCVLGLPTGSTPTGVYAELVRMHKEEGLSFRNVISFNLDEYYPMNPTDLHSYRRFMQEHLFNHVDIDPKNAHVPDGTLPEDKVGEYCIEYERKIKEAGGIDLQLLGIGRTGHIGFNEPGSSRDSRTRLITLDKITRTDAAADFFGEENVPRRGLTMGVGSILDARRIILIGFGEGKSPVVARAVEGPVTASVAGSFLQEHPNAIFILDDAASAQLTRRKCPWLVEQIDWTPMNIRRATIWLASQLKKSILKLTDEDYNENGLQDLLATRAGGAYEINLDVFRQLQQTITGWPGGKPAARKRAGDIDRPSDRIFPKRAVIFSPHPDDDVISMGGTLIRLVVQGHEVHVAYQTSGNIAVFDEYALQFSEFAVAFNRMFNVEHEQAQRVEDHVEEFVRQKKPGQIDSPQLQAIKGMIRQGEARAAGRECGIPTDRLHFMNMPFYETGDVKKKPLSEEDIRITVELLDSIKPHQIYAAGDLSDPHGTHRVCLKAVFEAVRQLKDRDWMRDCEVWLYRGAWQEWEPERIEMAVPLSPTELLRKRTAIFRHQSQKDRAMFPGSDPREFWQRAEERNRSTAELYDRLGLPEFEAIEGFVRWHPDDESMSG